MPQELASAASAADADALVPELKGRNMAPKRAAAANALVPELSLRDQGVVALERAAAAVDKRDVGPGLQHNCLRIQQEGGGAKARHPRSERASGLHHRVNPLHRPCGLRLTP